MSKLSPSLKSLIGAAHARPNTLPAPRHIRYVYDRIRQEAEYRNVDSSPWLALSTAATITMNSPESLTELFNLATHSSKERAEVVNVAEFMREVGLKCMGFNGVPRTINCLGAFHNSLPNDIVPELNTVPTRVPTAQNINEIISRGHSLWKSIYAPLDAKLVSKLADSHPDLPVFIVNYEYGGLFADPDTNGILNSAKIGRVLTSVVAISCLRAQSGVGPQVTSHVFGLRKAFEDGSYKESGELDVKGGHWLASDEGSLWILRSIDSIVEALGNGGGSSFAPGKAKL